VLAEAADKIIKVKNGKIKDIIINESPKAVSEVAW
jgi:putative ABC transport system ATP-binding protein